MKIRIRPGTVKLNDVSIKYHARESASAHFFATIQGALAH